MPPMQTRRRVLAALSLVGGAGLLGAPRVLAAEGPPEITTLRLPKIASLCVAPEDAAQDLLRAEGFTDIRYIETPLPKHQEALARGQIDFGLEFAPTHVISIDSGLPITILAGIHVGCFELFGHGSVRAVGDFKGKSVAIAGLNSPQHVFAAIIAAHVGIDPRKEINWVVDPSGKPKQLFIDGKVDGFLGLPPEPQELRNRQIGHVIVNSALETPWSQYFCCMLAGNPDFVRRYPVATKRVTRAILKTSDLCASQPALVAHQLVDGGFAKRYDYAYQTLRELPYDKWRDYDAEDTVRFYALRLHDLGFIKSTPQQIIANGTDWRFLNELQRELKA